ncbi:MAG: putative metal-binding motif-containing protein [Alphaproteobacteria bacterium]|nr:putative metal-binding motif-containing protein [Alphaproteobacteria bacterium]
MLLVPFALADSGALLWYTGHGGTPPGQAFVDAYAPLGATVDVVSQLPLDLAFYDAIVVGRPTIALEPGVAQDLGAFSSLPGRTLWIVGDMDTAPSPVDAVNTLLADLELDLRLAPEVNTMGGACFQIPITATNPWIPNTQVVATRSLGNVVTVGPSAELLAHRLLVDRPVAPYGRQGNVLVSADFASTSDDPCGLAARMMLWQSLVPIDCDRDDDGFTGEACGGPDCDDDNGWLHPEAVETCNGVDDDCDGLLDAEDPDVTDAGLWFRDADRDGFGDDDPVLSCVQPGPSWSMLDGDCDDDDPDSHPGGIDVCGDGADDDCDGRVEACPDGCGCQTPSTGPYSWAFRAMAALARR